MALAASILTAAHNNRKLYRNWHVPTLVLHGTADRLTNPADSVRFYDTIASEDKSLHLVEGGFHELLNDADREETLQTVLTWLDYRLSQDDEPSVLEEILS